MLCRRTVVFPCWIKDAVLSNSDSLISFSAKVQNWIWIASALAWFIFKSRLSIKIFHSLYPLIITESWILVTGKFHEKSYIFLKINLSGFRDQILIFVFELNIALQIKRKEYLSHSFSNLFSVNLSDFWIAFLLKYPLSSSILKEIAEFINCLISDF